MLGLDPSAAGYNHSAPVRSSEAEPFNPSFFKAALELNERSTREPIKLRRMRLYDHPILATIVDWLADALTPGTWGWSMDRPSELTFTPAVKKTWETPVLTERHRGWGPSMIASLFEKNHEAMAVVDEIKDWMRRELENELPRELQLLGIEIAHRIRMVYRNNGVKVICETPGCSCDYAMVFWKRWWLEFMGDEPRSGSYVTTPSPVRFSPPLSAHQLEFLGTFSAVVFLMTFVPALAWGIRGVGLILPALLALAYLTAFTAGMLKLQIVWMWEKFSRGNFLAFYRLKGRLRRWAENSLGRCPRSHLRDRLMVMALCGHTEYYNNDIKFGGWCKGCGRELSGVFIHAMEEAKRKGQAIFVVDESPFFEPMMVREAGRKFGAGWEMMDFLAMEAKLKGEIEQKFKGYSVGGEGADQSGAGEKKEGA